jgi:hypothetical protein
MSIRNLTPEDRPQIESWIAAEPEHSNNTFEWYSESGAKTVVYEDADGQVLVAKFTPCLRVDIDFNPDAGPSRIGKAIADGLKQTAEQARNQGFKEFVFESLSPKLSAFCERLGYKKCPDYRKAL